MLSKSPEEKNDRRRFASRGRNKIIDGSYLEGLDQLSLAKAMSGEKRDTSKNSRGRANSTVAYDEMVIPTLSKTKQGSGKMMEEAVKEVDEDKDAEELE